MSSGLAIAATTRVIASILESWVDAANLTSVLTPPVVSALAPDVITTGQSEAAALNLFLYQLMRNPGWSSERFPARDSSGTQIDRPWLALDLHYALSAYGSTDLASHALLGLGMQALHETPVLGRARIRSILGALHAPGDVLATSGLESQIEQIKISPLSLTLDDLSKLWMAFQAKFRPTFCYVVTVVLIESKKPVKSALPVLTRQVTLLPFDGPAIDSITPQLVTYTPGSVIQIQGQALLQPNMKALFGNQQTADLATTADRSKVRVTLPALPAGVNTVQVVRYVDLGSPPLRVFADSNVAAFILQPVVQRIAGPLPQPYDIQVSSLAGGATQIQVRVQPDVGTQQKVELLLNQLNPPPSGGTFYTLQAKPPDIAAGGVLQFRDTGLATGDYLLRVRVDGAESPLDVDSSGAFTAPRVHLA